MIQRFISLIKHLHNLISPEMDYHRQEGYKKPKYMLKVCTWENGKLVTRKYYFEDYDDCVKKYNKINDCVKMYNQRGEMIRTKNCVGYEQVYC